MQAISQLDQYYPHILCHSQQHFAEIFRLHIRLCLESDFVEFGNPIDKFSHGRTKSFADFLLQDAGILYHIV